MKRTEEIQSLIRHLKKQVKLDQDSLYNPAHTFRYRCAKRRIKKYEKWIKALES